MRREEPFAFALDARRPDVVATPEKVRFGARVLLANADPRVDWLIFGHPGIADAQRFVPGFLRKPFAVQLHGIEAWEEPLSPAVHGARLRIAPSRFTARRTREAHPSIGPIAVCPHGLLPLSAQGDRGAVDEALLARVHARSALIVGRLWPNERRKGHDQLLDCWPIVRQSVPDAQLVIAGTGDDLERYRRKAIAVGIADAVVFAGFVSLATLDALFERVGVFAMPSRQEGFGIVYIEAMRHGLPCVGATDDAADEPIIHGETGFLVEQTDLGLLAEAISATLRDPALRARLGAAGRRRFEAEFTFERYRDRLVSLLGEHFPPRSR